MKIDIEFAELHSPLFIKTSEKGGKNLGMKLSDNHYKGLKLTYDREHQELLVQFGDRTAIVPKHNVASMWESEAPATQTPREKVAVAVKAEQSAHKAGFSSVIDSQVSTPHSHVHAGPGHGKTK